MANRLILRDRRKDPWVKVSARIFWEGGGQDSVWMNQGMASSAVLVSSHMS